MRLSKVQIEKIKSIGQGIYGQDAKIYLFGSRTNDGKKGGDIDLIIETNNIQLTTLENKIKYLVDLKLALGDQKIDLVYQNQLIYQPSFKNSIDHTRIKL